MEMRQSIGLRRPDDRGDHDADADRDLEAEHQPAAELRWGQFGDVHGRGLGRPADREAQHQPAQRQHTGLGAKAHQSAPTTKTTASITSVPLRPRFSDSQLQVSAPMTAPSRMLAAITCFQPSSMPKSSVICRSAPEMIPVS